MPRLSAGARARLPATAFAYIDSRGRRRLPIHDRAHVKNALARFNQVVFEDEAARERARTRLLVAARRYGIVPVGFVTGQLRQERRHAAAGRLVIELGRVGAPGELEERLRRVLRDPTLTVLHWSDAAGAYLDRAGRPVRLPRGDDRRRVTLLQRGGRPMTALVHAPAVLDDPALAETVRAAVRFVVERDRAYGEVRATAADAAMLPTGFVTLLMTDIERSIGLLHTLGDGYARLLNEVRAVLRAATARGGHEIDARADEFFAVFGRARDAVEAAVAAQRALRARRWPAGVRVGVRIGIHSGRPTLTDAGYIGLPVHTTARVCAAAHGGQIVVSAEARAAVGLAPPGGIRFRSLGRHRLPGLRTAEVLFQVAAPGLPQRFPPLRVERGRRQRR
ncbi:MAG: adenylate/guanylate cyclase domain-containing protein [Armatimonadota bacterium]|nr:adenylate/guanylate cyclase domain-containing protein [Armatimonadota bacterium]MDR7456428.1 adenylate/guanylate cyclase domain-containing protein [Armatimonadota bacterium]MDR7495918.1 adenylate/guanylate cyclase domain-containing protein [Armatimonadota bacterium]